MKRISLVIAALLICLGVNAQKFENLAQTPQMGWNSWNKFASGVNEKVIRETIDTMVEMGLVDAGYIYINVDDFWHGERDANGFITANPETFPSGIKALADYAHSKGMKFGIYSDAGTNTCGGCPGSLGHEYQDALQYAAWGIDYLKYDWCSTSGVNPHGAYTLMRNALRAAGRPIFFSMCEWGHSRPWEWAAEVGHSWRTTGDICAQFDKDIVHDDPGNYWKQLSVLTILDLNEPLRRYAGPGHWNDPDMLEVGNGMSLSEDRAHFTMWCMMAAPLLLGNDLTTMSKDVLGIILNKDMIAIDQDPLGVQGFRYRRDGDIEYWFKPLEGGEWAFTILNRGNQDHWCTVDWNDFNLTDELSGCSTAFESTIYGYKDLWDSSVSGNTATELKVAVCSHDVASYRLTPKARRLVAKADTDKELLFFAPNVPTVSVIVDNPSDKKLSGKAELKLFTDKHAFIRTYNKKISVKPGQSATADFKIKVDPGFYRCEVSIPGGAVHKFNIGYEPLQVVSAPDPQPDMKEFWDKARAELAAVDPEFHLELVPEGCTPTNAMYYVSMKSLGGETITGYYSEPIKEGKVPAVISYMGYGSKPYYAGTNPDMAEFVLSVRGQGINEIDNRYGKWIEYRLDDPEQYYYRGAFMDVVRAIDFVCSREKVDKNHIFAQGGSQGGAFTFAACALDDRICAACPDVPFLSDYPDYFKIVDWPAWEVFEGQEKYGISDEQLFKNLSYFDIKNLAPWIKCPIYMAFGLQDETCPPHTNFAAYNNIPGEKKFKCYKLRGHSVWLEPTWYQLKDEFFRSFLPHEAPKVVVLGDSYSTFEGRIPEGYYCWYFSELPKDRLNDVTKAEQCWWDILCRDKGYDLLLNASFSGSAICTTGYPEMPVSSAFVLRVKEDIVKEDGTFGLCGAKPDIIYIFGGTNDDWNQSPLGSVIPPDKWREADISKSVSALCYILGYLKEKLPATRIVVILNTGMQPEFTEGYALAAKTFGAECVRLHDIDKIQGHPSIKGMAQIAEQLK